MPQTVEPRLPMAATISAGLFAIGVGYASTAPYDAIIAMQEAIRGRGAAIAVRRSVQRIPLSRP